MTAVSGQTDQHSHAVATTHEPTLLGWIIGVCKIITTSFLAGWAPSYGLLEHSQHLSFMYTHNTEPQEAPQAADFLHACAHGANFRATEQSQGLRFNTSPFASPAFQLWLVALRAQSSILQREKSDPVSPKTAKIISVSCTGSSASEHEGGAARPETACPMHCFLSAQMPGCHSSRRRAPPGIAGCAVQPKRTSAQRAGGSGERVG